MEITRIQIHIINSEKEKGVRAFADVILDNTLIIKNLVVVEGDDNVHIVYWPSKFDNSGKRIDITHPITDDFRIQAQNAILDKYEEVAKKYYKQNA